jgi:hypothetical protein
MPLGKPPKTADADAQFRKAQRAEDGKKAMAEYEADAIAQRAKTEKLRALRLARDAAMPAPPAKATPAAKAAKKVKSAPGKLTDWLKDQKDSGRNS